MSNKPVGWFKYDKVSECWYPQYEKYVATHAEREGWKQLYAIPPDAAARIAELEKQLSELRTELITSYGESEELSGEVAAVKKQRDTLLAVLEDVVKWFSSRRGFSDTVRPINEQPPEIQRAMLAISSMKGGAA